MSWSLQAVLRSSDNRENCLHDCHHLMQPPPPPVTSMSFANCCFSLSFALQRPCGSFSLFARVLSVSVLRGVGLGGGGAKILINISIFAPSFDLGVVIGVCSASSATFFIIQTMFGVDLNPPAFLQWHSNNRIFKRLQLRCIGNHTIFMHFVSNSADVQTLDGEIFQHNQSSSTHTSHQHLNEVLSLGSLFALNGFTMIIVMALRCTVKVFANNANNNRDNRKDGSWTMAPFPKKSNYVSTDSQSSDTQSGCR